MSERITIKSIAHDLGISHMTVSRALSNHPGVRDETRKAILKRASELGYVKSAVATAMRGESTGIIGLLVPTLTNEFYAWFANALALACETRGLQLITHLTNDTLARETQALLRLREMQADGVVIVPTPGDTDQESARLLGSMAAVQLIRRRADIPGEVSLMVEDAGPIRAAVDHLCARGHSRIGYIGGHEALSSGRERLAAFREGMARNRVAVPDGLIRTAPPSFEAGRHSLEAVLGVANPATAVVCGGFETSNGALEACMRRGINFPDDLAFVGYGNPAFYEWIQGGVSTIALPVGDLADQTADLISQGKDAEGQSISVPATFVIRNSS